MRRRMMLLLEWKSEMQTYTADDILNGITGTLHLDGTYDFALSNEIRYAFAYQPIEAVEAPNYIGRSDHCSRLDYMFQCCTKLKSINFPNAKYLTNGMFAYCTALAEVSFPSLADDTLYGGANVFNGCTSLQFADLGKIGTISRDNLFLNCSNLKTVILRSNSVVPVNAPSYWAHIFKGTPFKSGGTGGTIYVPEALIEDYKVATNWADIYALGTLTFAPIEGSEYE